MVFMLNAARMPLAKIEGPLHFRPIQCRRLLPGSDRHNVLSRSATLGPKLDELWSLLRHERGLKPSWQERWGYSRPEPPPLRPEAFRNVCPVARRQWQELRKEFRPQAPTRCSCGIGLWSPAFVPRSNRSIEPRYGFRPQADHKGRPAGRVKGLRRSAQAWPSKRRIRAAHPASWD